MQYIFDAKNEKLGRLASKIAIILQGKDSANYEPRLVGDNKVIVKNVKDLDISQKKMESKIYYNHTGYMGHLKEKTLKQVMEKDPSSALRRAVKNMLPKNFLIDKRIKNLIIE